MAIIPILRLAALATVAVFSLIVLGISAHITWFTTTFFGFQYTFTGMGIAVSVLTLLTLPAMIVIDMMRKGAFTSMIAVELSWLGILWVLWLSAAGLSADAGVFSFSGCGGFDSNSGANQACSEFSAVEAFAFLNWIIVFFYWLTILILSLIALNRGQSVFNRTVAEAPFFTPRAGGQPLYVEKAGVSAQAQSPHGYPPLAHQQTGQSQSYPQV